MSVRVLIVLSLLFSGDFTLPNGIRLVDLPGGGETAGGSGERPFVMVIGYQAGIRSENRGFSGQASIAGRYLASTPAARALVLAAYAAGGESEFLEELDRTALRLSVPQWARPAVLEQAAPYLADSADTRPGLMERARKAALAAAHPPLSPFRAQVEDEIRIDLLGSHPYHHPAAGWKTDLEQLTADDMARFFSENYGTDRAFLVSSDPVPEDIRQRLSVLPSRPSRRIPESTIRIASAERTMRFASGEAAGAVILASPVSGVVYRAWYSVLMLDRLVGRALPGKPATSMRLSLDPYYWRLEVPVPAGQFGEAVEESLLQEINRLQFARARPEILEAARRDAVEFLEGRYAREWFASHGIENHRQEGVRWIQAFTADDMRVAARDLLIMNRVLASWSPRAAQPGVQIENLAAARGAGPAPQAATRTVPLPALAIAPFPAHIDAPKVYSTPEKLGSGLWLAASSSSALFLSGGETSGLPAGARRSGPNGTLWSFSAEPDGETVRAFQKYRADRILLLVPPASLERARSLWGGFKSNDRDATVITPLGSVANIDIPALLVLKAGLDRRLIEAGWWRDASIRVDATQGASLQIDASPEIRAVILEWIKALALSPMSAADLAWAREVAIHNLAQALPDVQSILWQRVPDYILQDLQTIAASQIQDAAKLYF